MAKVESLGLKKLESLHYYVRDLARSRRFYTERLDFSEVGTSSPDLEARAGQRSAVFRASDCVVICSEPVEERSRAGRWLRKHPDGVGTVVFEVEDVHKTFALLDGRGGTPIDEVKWHEEGGGKLGTFSITTPFGSSTFRFVERRGYPTLFPGLVPHEEPKGGRNAFGFEAFDHVTSNFETMKPALLWMEHVMGFEEYWGIEFHTEDVARGSDTGSGLRSKVWWDPVSGAKFANNEPLRPFFKASQINIFHEDNRGDGIQHAAIAVKDIIPAVRGLRTRDVAFFPTPGAYYDMLPARIAELGIESIDEDIDVLRELQILIDGKGKRQYLLQIFLQDSATTHADTGAGPFFYEIIQRKGDKGFGGGNFRALFESIERQQRAEGRILMLDRMVVGEVPKKHHIKLVGEDGKLRHEHCITRRGFDGAYTIAYRLGRPHTQEHATDAPRVAWTIPEPAPAGKLAKHHLKTQDLAPRNGPALGGRVPMMFNRDVVVSVLHPSEPDPAYFANGDGDDLYFIFRGGGTLRSELGDVRFEQNDYLCVPKGILHRFIPDEGVAQHWLSIECLGGVGLLSQFRNETGQLRMDAPYCHRDFRRPTFRGPHDEGIRTMFAKRANALTAFSLESSPLDVVGWDGTVYPWVFPILAFQPRAGLVHLPPDWHGTFATRGALVCSFVPRVVDFHPEAIPCPYPHASVDCDEMLFYVSGNFTSRRGVGPGSISYHPKGVPHGPHPRAYEASVGVTRTDELAVMMDTFEPLVLTPQALAISDAGYMASFR